MGMLPAIAYLLALLVVVQCLHLLMTRTERESTAVVVFVLSFLIAGTAVWVAADVRHTSQAAETILNDVTTELGAQYPPGWDPVEGARLLEKYGRP